nr:MAG TPA: phosphodiesterase domain protein [Caudoviricetes sp.]
MYGLILLRFWCNPLIFSVKNFCLEPACALLLRLSWCVQPPETSPKGFTTRAYYIMHTGGRGEFRCNILPALLRS